MLRAGGSRHEGGVCWQNRLEGTPGEATSEGEYDARDHHPSGAPSQAHRRLLQLLRGQRERVHRARALPQEGEDVVIRL